jgi:putative acetyltransferase
MSQSITIRAFKNKDIDSLYRLLEISVRVINAIDYSQSQLKAIIRTYHSNDIIFNSQNTYLAESNNIVIGFITFQQYSFGSGSIAALFVHPDFLRQRIGSQLLEMAETKAKLIGIKRLYVNSSLTAEPFYMSSGYEYVKKVKTCFFGEDIDCILFFKSFENEKDKIYFGYTFILAVVFIIILSLIIYFLLRFLFL